MNPPHPSIGSRIPRDQLPPLGLLSIGGPLIDAGRDVTLLDGETGPLSHDDVVRRLLGIENTDEATLQGRAAES